MPPDLRTEYSYDAAGNLVSVKDPKNQATMYAFDALSRNTRVAEPLGQFVQYSPTPRIPPREPIEMPMPHLDLG